MPGISETLGGLFGVGGTVDVPKMLGPVVDMAPEHAGRGAARPAWSGSPSA